jgi:hypothetical protein
VRRASRGKTVLEALYPAPPGELVAIAKQWSDAATNQILDLVWSAHDRLVSRHEVQAAIAEATEDLERGITRLLCFAIDDELSGNEPFRLIHGSPEDESRKRPPARPREYDIAFVMRGNERIAWPLEGKVLETPGSVADYVKTIRERFLTAEYAPFVTVGAMVGYLRSGEPEAAFVAIGEELQVRMAAIRRLKTRPHRLSSHQRQVEKGKRYPKQFRCHHLVMDCHSERDGVVGNPGLM